MLDFFATIGALLIQLGPVLASLVTAVATIFLWRVTKTLAKETRRMAAASAQPHVVATLEPNQWSNIHFDLRVENTGNAAAYEIQVSFDPPLENGDARGSRAIPLQNVSVLKPGQRLSSYLSEYASLQGRSFKVVVSWRRMPAALDREENRYTLNMSDVEGSSWLGVNDPLVQIAQEVKHMREDWQPVARGSKKPRVDVYTREDRDREEVRLVQQIAALRTQERKSARGRLADDTSSTPHD